VLLAQTMKSLNFSASLPRYTFKSLFGGALLALLASSAFGQVRFLPGDTSISQAIGTQNTPAVARGGGQVLVVWTDFRSNPFSFYEYETSKDIYGMRFDANGNRMDATPIPIAVGAGSQESPKVSWNGTNWLVAFSTAKLGGTGFYVQKGLAAVRVAPSGDVLDREPIDIPALPGDSYWQWDLASDGSNWVVVSQAPSGSTSVIAIRISASGFVMDPPTRTIVAPSTVLRGNFHLAFADGIFLLISNDNNGAQAFTSRVRFTPTLAVLDPAPVPLIDHHAANLTSNGGQFYLISTRQMPNFTVRVNGTRVDTNGIALDGAGVNISGTLEPQYGWDLYAIWSGSDWRVSWGTNNTLRVATVNQNGTVVNPAGVPVVGVETGPIAPLSSNSIFTAWTAFQNQSFDIKGARVLPNGSTGSVEDLSVGASAQLRSDSAVGANGYMVVYRSADSAAARILAQPLDFAGDPITGEPTFLFGGTNINGPSYPCVVWTGANYMVSWSSGATVYGQRVRQDGTKVDANPFVVMSGYFGPSEMAILGDTVLVLGRKTFQNGQVITVFAARVRASDAAVLDPTPLVIGGQYVATAPAVTQVGGKFLVLYHSNVTHDNPTCFTEGAFVPINGSPQPRFTIHGPFSTAGGNGIFEVGLASNGTVALVAQSQELTSGVETDLLYRLVDANGMVSNYTNLTPWIGNQYRPRAAWDGRAFVIVYQEQKNRTTYWTLDAIDARSDLFGIRVRADGQIVDPMGFMFSAQPFGETDPSVAASNGRSLLHGSIMRNEPELSSYRVAYALFGSSDNEYPVAVATASPNGGNVPLNVAFNSAGSNDPDGSIVSYLWDFGDGTMSTLQNPGHTYNLGHPVTAKLTVTDDEGARTTQAILIWPTQPNLPPIASGVASPWFGNTPLNVVFDAEGSYDPDGFLGNIMWRFGDDQSEYYGFTAYHTFTNRGVWPVDLTVWDSNNATGSSRLFVVVGPSAILVPSSANTTAGYYQSGNVGSLAASDNNYYVISSNPATRVGVVAQLDAGFTAAQSTIQGFVARVETSVAVKPAQNVQRKLFAYNFQTNAWDLLDVGPSSLIDMAFDVAVTSNGSRYVEPITRRIKLRLAWRQEGVLLTQYFQIKTDLIRLTLLYP